MNVELSSVLMGIAEIYTGNEESVEVNFSKSVEPDALYEIRPAEIDKKAVPIYDDELQAVVGYDYNSNGFSATYDLNGEIIGTREKALETPLIDPTDLIFFVGGVPRVLGKTITRGAAKIAATGAVRAIRVLTPMIVGALRSTFKGLSVRSLKFTAKTAARMATAGRHVPIHILHLALKFGKRVADPQGVKGAFLYTHKMIRNGVEYTLEVVVRESDWTVLHFLYK